MQTLLLCLFSSLAFASWSEETKKAIDEKIATHFQNKSQVGVVIGAIHGNESFTWNYGERILGGGQKPNEDHFFEIGSITKTYTTTLLALEVLRGKVSLTTPLKELWPELDGKNAGDITLEQLATHHSGLPRMPSNFAPSDEKNPYKDYDEKLLTEFLTTYKQDKKAPFDYEYSNIGLGLLGFVLSEKLNHQNYSDYLQKNLLSPLALSNTKTKLLPLDLLRAAQGYGDFFELFPFWDLNVLDSAGVLKSTLRDMFAYVKFQLKPDSSMLGQAVLLTHQPRAKADHDFQIGLGWEIGKVGEHNVITHGGATGGYRANIIFEKEKQLAGIMLSNTSVAPKCALAPIFGVDCKIPDWAHVDPKTQEKFLGNYFCKALKMKAAVFQEKGILGIAPEGQPRTRLWASSETEYKIPAADAVIRFEQENKFVLEQNNMLFTFEKQK